MSPSEAEEQAERRRVMLQDADVRRQQSGSTFLDHTHDDTSGGRFAAIGKPSVIGSTPSPATAYPAASPALQVELPSEPPLGFENPALESPTSLPSPVDTGPASDGDAPPVTPFSGEQRADVGPTFMAAHRMSQMSSAACHPAVARRAERPPTETKQGD